MLKCFVVEQQKKILANLIMMAKLQMYNIKNKKTVAHIYGERHSFLSTMDTSGENMPHRSALSGGLPFLCCHLY